MIIYGFSPVFFLECAASFFARRQRLAVFQRCYGGFGLFFRGRNRRSAKVGIVMPQNMVGPLPDQSHSLLFFRLCRGFGKAFGQVVEPVPIGEEIGELIPYHRVCALWRSKVQQAGNVIGMFGQKNIRSFIHPGRSERNFLLSPTYRNVRVRYGYRFPSYPYNSRPKALRTAPARCCIACRDQ